jgi:hypothetical protein
VASRYEIRVGIEYPKSVIPKLEKTLLAVGLSPLFVLNPEKLRTGGTVGEKILKNERPKFQGSIVGTLLIFDDALCFGAHDSQNGRMLGSAKGAPTLMQ